MNRPFPWEASYPPGLSWDAPLLVETLPAMLDRAVREYGDQCYIEFRGREISFRELGRRVDRAAAGLQRLGVKPGDTVALYLPNTPYHPIGFFAILRAGARVVHLSPLDPTRALARKLTDSGARVLIAPDYPTMLPNAVQLLVDGCSTIWSWARMRCGEPDRRRSPSRPTTAPWRSTRWRPNRPAPGRRLRPVTSRCCNIPGAPPGCPGRRC